MTLDVNFLLEITAVIFSLIFLILLIKEIHWCWPFGIISSVLSVLLFYRINLYAESFLYLFYALFGFYGWYIWSKNSRKEAFKITRWKTFRHLFLVIGGIAFAVLLFYAIPKIIDLLTAKGKEAVRPKIDAITTSFGFIATFLEAHKIFATWIYWIILNATSVFLYLDRGLPIYASLMVIYFGLSIYGYMQWNKIMKASGVESRKNS